MILVIAAGLAGSVAANDDGTAAPTPVPSVSEKDQSLQMIKRLFAKDYAKHAPSDRRALADRFIKQSRDGGDSPAIRFVLLSEARGLAVLGADRSLAMTAADELLEQFAVPSPEARLIRLDVLSDGGRLAAVPGAISAAIDISEQSLRDDDFEQAERAARLAQSRPNSNMAAIRLQLARVESARREHAAAVDAEAKLKSDPNDSEAMIALGRYLCFVKSEWARGLPLLAKAGTGAVQVAASRDLALLGRIEGDPPADPSAMADAADAWWALAEPATKTHVPADDAQRRAAYWYEQSLVGLKGIRRVEAEKRLDLTREHKVSAPTYVRQYARTDDGSGFIYSNKNHDLSVVQGPFRARIYGRKETDINALSNGRETSHYGKGIFIPIQSVQTASGTITAGVPWHDDATYYYAMFLSKDDNARSVSLHLNTGETWRWKMTRVGSEIVLAVGKENSEPMIIRAPADSVIAFGFGTTLRWLGNLTDITINFD